MSVRVLGLVVVLASLGLAGCESSSGDSDATGGGGNCDPHGELWMSNCSNGCGPVMTCFASCPSCSSACQIGCNDDFDCARAGAGFCRSQNCSACTRVCSGPPTTCDEDVPVEFECRSEPDWCNCEPTPSGNGEDCGPTTLPGATCCASPDWPAAGSSCRCFRHDAVCVADDMGADCACKPRSWTDDDVTSLEGCHGDVCCLVDDPDRYYYPSCSCNNGVGTEACGEFEVVASCPAGLGGLPANCESDEVPVATCTQ